MTDMQERQSPPALPAVEADTLISGKIIGILKKILYYGFPVAARFKTSLRVGSANTQTALDGLDGAIVADGTVAILAASDRTGTGNRVSLYRTGTKFYLATNDGSSTLIEFDALTGIVTQDALTALASRGANISGTDPAGVAPSGSRIVKPTGNVYVQLALTATGAVAAGGTICTLAAAHAPVSGNQAVYLRKDNTASSGAVLTSGVVVTDAALVAGDTVIATFEYYR